jgi:hypothetical protein
MCSGTLSGLFSGPAPIAVPNVNVDEFSSLLTFMYTGYLDLNLTNIYNILLATHILHMPRALEICRSFLLQSQPSVDSRPSIIKPIASRKAAPPTQQIYAPAFSHLQKSEATPFKAVNAGGDKEKSRPSTSKDEAAVQDKPHSKPEKNKTKKRSGEGTADKVIIDIACCDGPVRFHRVVNKNYGQQQHSENVYEMQEVNKNAAMNKVMNESIRGQQMSDENQGGNSEMFTCLYCNHTFKSQYCYQKHARRHLNPVSLDAKSATRRPQREQEGGEAARHERAVLPVQDLRLEIPQLLFRPQAQEDVPRGGDGRQQQQEQRDGTGEQQRQRQRHRRRGCQQRRVNCSNAQKWNCSLSGPAHIHQITYHLMYYQRCNKNCLDFESVSGTNLAFRPLLRRSSPRWRSLCLFSSLSSSWSRRWWPTAW